MSCRFARDLFISIAERPEFPKIEETVDENGVRTIVEYTINDEGKKVKVFIVTLH